MTHSFINRLPLVATLLIFAAICVGLYLQLYPFINEHFINPSPRTSTQANTPLNTAAKDTRPDYKISSFKLFGDPSVKPVVVVEANEELPETNLKLTLRGILASGNGDMNSALVEGPDRSTELYKIGDTLPGNAKLDAIFPERIVLNRSGRRENLYFPEVSKGGGPIVAYADDPSEAEPAPITREIPSPSSDNNARSRSIKDRLDAIRQRIRSERD